MTLDPYAPFYTDECRCAVCLTDPLPAVASPPLVPTYCTLDGSTWCKAVNHVGRCTDCPVLARPDQLPRRIIAFTGLAGAGKSTAAAQLVNVHGFARVRFAGPLKDMMRALGLTEAEIEGDRKEKPCDLLGGKTPRYAMQTIGTEWGRNMIGADLWIRAWRTALDRVPAGQPVTVDDARFPNEAEAVRAAGGVMVRVVRAGVGAGAAWHLSEAHELPSSMTLDNNGSFEVLRAQVDTLARA